MCKFFWLQKSQIQESVSFFTTEHVFRTASTHASRNGSNIFIRASIFSIEKPPLISAGSEVRN